MKRSTTTLAGLILLAVFTTSAQAVTITHGSTTITMDFVSVGNPHNDGDVQSQGTFGAVDYSYNIGKYEVTENQWDAVSGASTTDLLDDSGFWSGDQPVAHISWYEIAMFCNWLTSGDVTNGAYAINGSGEVTAIDRGSAVTTHGTVYVIPTEDEWYKAAYYDPNKGGAGVPGYWDYPTRNDDPYPPDGINIMGDTAFDAVFDDGYNQGHPNDVDNAGVLGPYGTMGQGGNVWERNETAIGLGRGGRGGKWNDISDSLAASFRNSSNLTSEYYGVGFRVAAIPEPGTITLLLCGLAGMTLIRRR